MMARLAYGALLWLALPFVVARLAWRARREPRYLEHLGERFGGAPRPVDGPVIWVHAVSVGETRAAEPLVAVLLHDHPRATILLTHMTPTGRATGVEIFGDRVMRSWLPWDLGFAVRRFLDRARPAFGVLLETEVWPNLLGECHARDIPVFLVNARLSKRSAAGYARVAPLAREALGHLAGVAAQTLEDARRLEALGAKDVAVTGNIKFDLAVPEDIETRGRNLRSIFGPGRRIWVVGSTRDGEESLLVEAIEEADPAPDVLVVVVPRHPQRFEEVASLLSRGGAPVARRSLARPVPAAARYALGDSMGEMLGYCAAADIVFVGGSLLPLGGQNLIEAAACGCPSVVGPHTFNFLQATADAIAAGAARRVDDADGLAAAISRALAEADELGEMRAAAAGFAAAHRGATARTVVLIRSAITGLR